MTDKHVRHCLLSIHKEQSGEREWLWFQTQQNGNTETRYCWKTETPCCFQRFFQSNLKLLPYTMPSKSVSTLWRQQSLAPAERTWCLYLVSLQGSDFISQKKCESIFYISGYKSGGKITALHTAKLQASSTMNKYIQLR